MTKQNATKSSDNRARIWAAVVYPDSAPENWRQLLDDLHIEWVESPLHDRDVNETTGELKKAHWHIVLSFDGKKSFEQVSDLLTPIRCPIPQRCHSMKGAVRYLAHLDNPEKAPYKVTDIVPHGGFDLTGALTPSASERYELVEEMQSFCFAEGIVEFADLCDYARRHRRDDWFPLLCDSCAFVMREYLKSRRFKLGIRPGARMRRSDPGPDDFGSDPKHHWAYNSNDSFPSSEMFDPSEVDDPFV